MSMDIIKTDLTLERLVTRMEEYKKTKPNQSIHSIGMFFETKNNKYFFDTGTGKVMKIEDSLKQFLIMLFDGVDYSGIKKYAELMNLDLPKILSFIDIEDILKGTSGNKLYNETTLSNAKKEIESGCHQLILELTGNCNLRCRYCIYNSIEKSFRQFNNEVMPLKTIYKSIDYLYEHSEKEVFISFYGGEPLLQFDLIKQAIEYAKIKLHDRELHFGFTTNMTLMTTEMAQYFVNVKNLSIVCSLDGPKEIHDLNRVYVDGRETYNDVIHGLEVLRREIKKANNQSFSINFNAVFMVPYTEEKLHTIDENFQKLCDITDNSGYEITYPTPGTIPDELRVLVPDKTDFTMWNWMVNVAKECESILDLKNRGIRDALIIIHNRILTEKNSPVLPMNSCCVPGVRRLYIDTKGDFYACERIDKSPKIGTIENGIDMNVIESKYFMDYSSHSIKYCTNCWAAKMCPLCYSDRMNEGGISPDAHKWCEELKKQLKINFSFYHELLEEQPEKLHDLNNIIVT